MSDELHKNTSQDISIEDLHTNPYHHLKERQPR
jgi:hypothetical protein